MPTTLLRRLRSPSNSTKSHPSSETNSSLNNSSKSPLTTPTFLPASSTSNQIRTLPTKIGYAELDQQDLSHDSRPSISFEDYSRAEQENEKGIRPEWIDVSSSRLGKEWENSNRNLQSNSAKDFATLPHSVSSPSFLELTNHQSHHPHHPRSRSRSRSGSRSRSRSRQGSSPSLPSSLPDSKPSHFPWSRRQSLPSSFSSSSSLSTSSFSSFGSSIKTCVDPRGRKVLARRDSDVQNSPPPRYARHRSGVFGIGEESEGDGVGGKTDEGVRGNEKEQKLLQTSPIRPPLQPLLIPHCSSSQLESSIDHHLPRSPISTSPQNNRRRQPQPISTFTPPPPLLPIPQSAFSSFSAQLASNSSSLSRRRSGVLRRSSSQSQSGNKLSRSTSIYVPKMQASSPREETSSPLSFDEPYSPCSLFPLTPPRSPTLSVQSSSTGYSTDPLLVAASSPVAVSPVLACPKPSFDTYSIANPPRRASLVSFDLPASPLSATRLEETSENVDSKAVDQARSPRTNPPVAFKRYRQSHQRSYSEGYPSKYSSSSNSIKIPSTVLETQNRQSGFARLNLKLANPDAPARPPKSPLRKVSSSSLVSASPTSSHNENRISLQA